MFRVRGVVASYLVCVELLLHLLHLGGDGRLALESVFGRKQPRQHLGEVGWNTAVINNGWWALSHPLVSRGWESAQPPYMLRDQTECTLIYIGGGVAQEVERGLSVN